MNKRDAEVDRQGGWLLDEVTAVAKLRRRSFMRAMNGRLERRPRESQQSSVFRPGVDDALRVIA